MRREGLEARRRGASSLGSSRRLGPRFLYSLCTYYLGTPSRPGLCEPEPLPCRAQQRRCVGGAHRNLGLLTPVLSREGPSSLLLPHVTSHLPLLPGHPD